MRGFAVSRVEYKILKDCLLMNVQLKVRVKNKKKRGTMTYNDYRMGCTATLYKGGYCNI